METSTENSTTNRSITKGFDPVFDAGRRAYQVFKVLQTGDFTRGEISEKVGTTANNVYNCITEMRKRGYSVSQGLDLRYHLDQPHKKICANVTDYPEYKLLHAGNRYTPSELLDTINKDGFEVKLQHVYDVIHKIRKAGIEVKNDQDGRYYMDITPSITEESTPVESDENHVEEHHEPQQDIQEIVESSASPEPSEDVISEDHTPEPPTSRFVIRRDMAMKLSEAIIRGITMLPITRFELTERYSKFRFEPSTTGKNLITININKTISQLFEGFIKADADLNTFTIDTVISKLMEGFTKASGTTESITVETEEATIYGIYNEIGGDVVIEYK